MTTSPRLAAAIGFLVLFGAAAARAQNPPAAGQGGGPAPAPNAGLQEVFASLQALVNQQPADDAAKAKRKAAIIEAADKLLAAKIEQKDVLLFIANAKAQVLDDPLKLSVFENQLTAAGRKEAARLVHRRLLEIQLERAAGSGDAQEFARRIEDVKALLSEPTLEPGDDGLALRVAMAAEQSGNPKRAAEICDDLSKLVAADSRFDDAAKRLSGGARRLRLIGSPIKLEGKTLDGKDLNWPSYRGKVVLVMFWTRSVIPFFKDELYKRYHDKGLDLVTIILDDQNRQQLADSLKKENLPWAVCRDGDVSPPMSQYYGVWSLPLLIVVGRDGNVMEFISHNITAGDLFTAVEKGLKGAAPVVREPGKKAGVEARAEAKKEKEKQRAEERAARLKKLEQLKTKAKAVKPRTWSDASGSFHVTAKFRGVVNGMVKLEKEDGEIINVPLEKLSEEDQKYVRQRQH